MLAGLVVWYAGLPWLNLTGARDQRLIEATALLERSANHQINTIRTSIAERRGDVKLLAESPQAIAALTGTNRRVQRRELGLFLKRIERAYPGQYDALRLIDPNGNVLASTIASENDQPFFMPELVARASASEAIDLVEEITNGDHPALAIVRPVMAMDADGNPRSGVLGILVASMQVDTLLSASTGNNRNEYPQAGNSLVLGANRKPLTLLPPEHAAYDVFLHNQSVASGVEGSL